MASSRRTSVGAGIDEGLKKVAAVSHRSTHAHGANRTGLAELLDKPRTKGKEASGLADVDQDRRLRRRTGGTTMMQGDDSGDRRPIGLGSPGSAHAIRFEHDRSRATH